MKTTANNVVQATARTGRSELFYADLARRGLTPAQAEFAGIEFTSNARADIGAEFRSLAGVSLRYFDADGLPVAVERGGEFYHFERVRYLEDGPRSFSGKRAPKYQQPARTRSFAYLPRVEGCDWNEVSADPEQPLLIVEGEFKSLVATLAGFPTIGLGGVFNFMHDGQLLPELRAFANGRRIYIVHDRDPSPKTRRNVALAARRLAAQLASYGAIPHIATLPHSESGKTALDEFLQSPEGGAEALEVILNNTPPVDLNAITIQAGTHVEVADAVLRRLEDEFGSSIVYCEGEFYAFNGTCWMPLPQNVLAKAVYHFDRTPFGQRGMIKLTDGQVNSIIAIMRNLVADPDFFAEAPQGINAANGFIVFDADGSPFLEPHDREHRQRHCLAGSWSPENDWRAAPLLRKLLDGCFCDDADAQERVDLIGDVCGVAVLGVASRMTSPRAVVFHGAGAENGKSEILAMTRGLLPSDAVASVPPTRFSDERMLAKLIGRSLNACDELGTAQAIAGDTFKSVVTGNPVIARDLYKPAVSFRPVALHLFATNVLPAFNGGFDRGVQRRLLVIPFTRSIPRHEQIPEIGSRIAREEADALLAFAVEGAARVLRTGHFTEPQSSRLALSEWVFSADPVLAWLSNRADYAAGERLNTKQAYEDFKLWAELEGFRSDRLPGVNHFVQRLLGQDGRLRSIKNNDVRSIEGLRLKGRRHDPFGASGVGALSEVRASGGA